jgi:hypothetical protein
MDEEGMVTKHRFVTMRFFTQRRSIARFSSKAAGLYRRRAHTT